MSQEETSSKNSSKFIIQSKLDNQEFIVDEKVINSSSLLKNIFGNFLLFLVNLDRFMPLFLFNRCKFETILDITEITEPILVNCTGESLAVFINLIDHYQSIEDKHDGKFEKDLFDSSTLENKQKLIKLIQDLCILDSDFFLDSIADYILGILGDKEKMDWKDIQIYLGLEDDFSETERKLILKEEKELEYFLSIDTENFKFPFANKNLYSLKTDFSTPMNVLIARIVKRSNEKISYLLSLINKTLKNEVDRHPIKVTKFDGDSQFWNLNVHFKNQRSLMFNLNSDNYDEKYFNILRERKIIAGIVSLGYDIEAPSIRNNSFDFIISTEATIFFEDCYKSIYHFDVKRCQIPFISYEFLSVEGPGIKINEFYNHLIGTDLTKEVKILIANDFLKLFSPKCFLRFYKKPNASKFHAMLVRTHRGIYNEFKNFVTKYMEDDGYIKSAGVIHGIPLDESGVKKVKGYYYYPVMEFKKYMNSITVK